MQPVQRTNLGGQAGCLAGTGLLLIVLSPLGLLFLLPIATAGDFNLASLLSLSNIGPLLGAGITTGTMLLIGLVIMAVGGRTLLARARLTRPEVTLSNQTPRINETVTLNYQQTFRRSTDVQGIRYQLVLREKATYRRGTETITVHHDNVAQEFQTPGRHFSAGESFQEQRQFRVGGMHSFDASHNKLLWVVHVQVDMAGWPSFEEEYPLQVPPEFAA